MRSFLILFCFLIFTVNVWADKQYSFLQVSNSDGLVNNQVTCIHKDRRGFVWIGTTAGLSRYDGSSFVNYKHNSTDSNSIVDNYIVDIQEDKQGDLLIQTRLKYVVYDIKKEVFYQDLSVYVGLDSVHNIEQVYVDDNHLWLKFFEQTYYSYLDPETKEVVDVFPNQNDNKSYTVDFLYANGDYYYLFSNGTIECYNGENFALKFHDEYLAGKLGIDSLNANIFVDAESDLWFYGNNKGVYCYKAATQQWKHYAVNSGQIRLSSNLIKSVIQDEKGQIWVGTDHGGIDVINKYSNQVVDVLHQSDNEKSVAQNSITKLYIDNNNIVWVGTYKNGVSYYHESIHKFHHYQHLLSDPTSLPYNDVNCFEEDKYGNLWIGTNGGGLIYFNRKTKKYKTYRYDKNNPKSLSSDVVVGLFIDSRENLWVGTYTGGLNRFDGNSFKRYQYEEDKDGGLTSNNVWSINEDAKGNIWIATLGGGIVLYDYTIDGFKPLPNNGTLTLPTRFIGQIYKLSNGNMFIATANGVAFYDTQEQRYKHHPSSNKAEPLSLSSKTVNGVFEDSRGLLWVATREGLIVFDPNSEYIKNFTVKDGLPEDVMNCIQEDEFHSIWVSKSTGFSQIIVSKLITDEQYDFQIYDFTEEDGLQAKEFNPDASFKTSKGELIFGGPNGFNLFKAKDIIYNKILPNVVFTDFQVYNQSLSPDSKVNKVKLLDRSIISTKSIDLKHALNVFSIDFTALDFFIPHKIKYAYKLEGFNEQWIVLDGEQPRVTYTNLNPGDYYFQVKASNSDGLWNPEYAELHVKVLPPAYASPIAYFVYVILLISLIVFFRYRMIRNQSIRFATEKERLIARRNHEMDEMKFRFLTNVSHEFRTPLTLIMSPLDRLMKKTNSLPDKRLLEIIDRNAKSLLALVNQLLDVRKLELNGLRYHPASGDVVSFLKEVIHNFDDAFKKKNIFYEFDSSVDYFEFNFDKEKLDKVMMNLLSNAMKFTPEGGRVSVNLLVADDENSITISVEDNGVGIAVEDIEKIFIRFYQSEGNKKLGLSGSGIGLNLARELVQLHKGTIQVESNQGEGARFIVTMPVDKSILKKVGDIQEEDIDVSGEKKLLLLNKKKTKTSILVVEDNLDFRMFMVETLHEKFEVFQAADGKAGLDMAHKKYPDLIISDVTMPIMDGLEMCKLLRDDIRTSHIPLILLTARTADEDKIKGLEIGADDYITKPFNMDFLLLKVDKLIAKRVKMQQQFQKTVDINPSEVQITTKDEKLIKKALHIVEKNISEPKFSVVDLSQELGMSRVYLYKKLLSITGKTPVEFIRIIRLKRGTQLLKKSQMNIAEVAYEVGFNSPRYFSKYFKEEYGMLPTEWMKKNGD